MGRVDICNGDSCQDHGFLLIHTEEDPSWQSLGMSLAELLKKFGNVQILDLSKRNFPKRVPPSKAVQAIFSLFGFTPVESTIERLRREYPVISPPYKFDFEDFDEEGEESVKSAIFSFLRATGSGRFSLLRRVLASRLRRDYSFSRGATARALMKNGVCTAVIPNGRFPVQRGSLTAAISIGKKTLFYEKSWKKDHFYLRKFQTQDFFAQTHSIRGFVNRSDGYALSYAEDWFSARLSARDHLSEIGTKFAHRTSHTQNENFIAIFTSSADEFEALGELWPKPAWKHQYEAFSALLASKPAELDAFLRVHPNSKNKPISYAIWEISQLRKLRRRFSNLRVISPMSREDSYSLASRAQAVYVWESTIGLEASYLGKQVYNFAPSTWSEICRAESVLKTEDLISDASPAGGEISRVGALAFIAGFTAFDYGATSPSSWKNGASVLYFIRNIFCLKGILEWTVLIQQALSSRLSRLAYKLLV